MTDEVSKIEKVLQKESGNKLPWEKSIKELFSKDTTLEDIGYVINSLVSAGLQVGGIDYAIGGDDPNHIRDGILIFICGKVLEYGYKGLKYLERINDKNY